MFDPLSWAIGFFLTKGSGYFFDKIFSDDLPLKLRKDVEEWGKGLSTQLQFNYEALEILFDSLTSDDELVKFPKLAALREKLGKLLIPTEEDWYHALYERWEYIRSINKQEDLPAFFILPPDQIKHYLQNLDSKLTLTCTRDADLFKVSTFRGIREIQSDLTVIKQTVMEQSERKVETIAERIHDVESASSSTFAKKYPKDLVDDAIKERLNTIRRARFIQEFSAPEKIFRLADKIQTGEFETGSDVVKCTTLAWCARFLAFGENIVKAEALLTSAKLLGDVEEITIADAFITGAKGNLSGALSKLSNLSSTVAKSASLFIVANHLKNPSATLDWLSKAAIKFADLDAEGKFKYLTELIELDRWGAVLECVADLQDKDYEEAPIIYHTAAIAYLLKTVPDEIKQVVLQQVPFNSKTFFLASTEEGLTTRRKAQNLFQKFALVVQEFDCTETAKISSDYALWLELRDPEYSKSGLQNLEASMRDPVHSLRRLPLALNFGLKLDLYKVEKEIDRQTALSGGASPVAAMARFALVFMQKNPKESVDYIDRHREQLQKYVTKQSIDALEIEKLVEAGLPQRAKDKVNALVSEGLSDAEQRSLLRIIDTATAVDPIELRRATFENSKKLADLIDLVQHMEMQKDEQKDWPQFCHYSALLFDKTKDLSNAERLAKALNATQRFVELMALLRKYPEFIDQSDDLQTLWSWALYREGDMSGATAALEKLKLKRDVPNDRALTVNLAITSGAWGSLLPYVEKEWKNREEREADELMQTAKLAQHIGSQYAKELIRFAANKGSKNPQILAAAYFVAVSAGWEDETTTQWLNKAAELSDKNGPIQRMSIKEIMDRKPAWDRRENDTWQQINQGNLPIFIAGQLINRTLIDMILLPALANPREPDIRKRGIIPSYSGSRSSVSCEYRVVAIESNALLTLAILGLLDRVFDSFERIVIPHSTLRWLFEEKQKSFYHQPSRIQEAHRIMQLIARKDLKEFTASVSVDTELSAEVGEELASLLSEVKSGSDEKQKIVIRSYPVHRVASFMEEEVDLSSYFGHICSCTAIVDKLKQKGQLTAVEEQRARSYLSMHEQRWPQESAISDNAVLYLDSLSITYLQHTGLLAKLKPAGLDAYISTRALDEVNGLIHYEQLSSEVNRIIESIRSSLASRIEKRSIRIGRVPQIDKREDMKLRDHPTMGIYDLINDVEALIIDDRHFNQYQQYKKNDSGDEHIPLLTTLDLLDALQKKEKDPISLDEVNEYRTRLRQAGYIYLPVTFGELQQYLAAAQVVDGTLKETAELKAIRENLLRIRMSHFLQLPKEAKWFVGFIKTIIRTLRAQWTDTLDDKTMEARSEWLLQLVDVRGWVHCFGKENCQRILNDFYGTHIMLLLTAPPNTTPSIKNKYLKWVEERLLARIREEEQTLYTWLLDSARDLITNIVTRGLQGQ